MLNSKICDMFETLRNGQNKLTMTSILNLKKFTDFICLRKIAIIEENFAYENTFKVMLGNNKAYEDLASKITRQSVVVVDDTPMKSMEVSEEMIYLTFHWEVPISSAN